MGLAQKMDLIFASLHGSSISEAPGIIKTLMENIMRTYENIPLPLVMKYSRQRSHMRKRFLSSKLKAAKREEAKAKAEAKAKKDAEKGKKTSSATARNALLDESARRRNRTKAKQNSGV